MVRSYPTRFNAQIICETAGAYKIIPLNVMPESINESLSANFNQQDIIGASVPRIVYSNTSAKQISFSLANLTEDYMPQGYNLHSYINALQSLVYPTYAGTGLVNPPRVHLILGNRSYSAVCTNVGVSWGDLVKDNNIIRANVDLSFIAIRNDVPGATYIQNGG